MKTSKFKNQVSAYFSFSKGERNGIIFMTVLLALLIIIYFLVPVILPANEKVEFSEFKQYVDSLYKKDPIVTAVPLSKTDSSKFRNRENVAQEVKIELNISDSAQLTSLPGIGPVLASRIVKYRKLLGGYYNINQLQEVYGLKPEYLDKAKKQIYIDITNIQRISPDTAGFKTLVRHPYIGKDKASAIIKFRKNKQIPISYEDFKNSGIFDSVQWNKVQPYFLLIKNPL